MPRGSERTENNASSAGCLYETVPIGLAYLDREMRFTHANQEFARIQNLPVEEYLGRTVNELLPSVAKQILPMLESVQSTAEPVVGCEVTADAHGADGEPSRYRYDFYPDRDTNDEVIGICCAVRDLSDVSQSEEALVERNQQLESANLRLERVVTALRHANAEIKGKAIRIEQANKKLASAEKEIQQLSLYDRLTGLGNRELFQRQLEHLIAIAERRNEEVAILKLDLDGFRAINDQFGQAAGNDVLRECSVRLRNALRKADQKYRIGGDEFAILLEPRSMAIDGALTVAGQIADQISVPMEIDGHSCAIGISIGIAVFPEDGRNFDALLKMADASMHQAKERRQIVSRESDSKATTVITSSQSKIFQLVYVSTAVRPMSDNDLVNLMLRFGVRYDRMRITGMCLYKDGHFMEVLEGEETVVKKLFAEIQNDRRHKSVDTLRSGYVVERSFPSWTMGFESADRVPTSVYTPFLSKDDSPEYFSEESVEAHAMLLAFKGVSLKKVADQRTYRDTEAS